MVQVSLTKKSSDVVYFVFCLVLCSLFYRSQMVSGGVGGGEWGGLFYRSQMVSGGGGNVDCESICFFQLSIDAAPQ